MERSLEAYQEKLAGHVCKWCGTDISTRGIRSYDHSGGYIVKEYTKRQWLYVKCGCSYEWSLRKLGIEE